MGLGATVQNSMGEKTLAFEANQLDILLAMLNYQKL